MKKEELLRIKACIISLMMAASGVTITGCSKENKKDMDKAAIEQQATVQNNQNVLESTSENTLKYQKEAESFYEDYQDFFKDYYDNTANPKEEILKDINNVIMMVQNNYKDENGNSLISEPDLRRAFRLIQDSAISIEYLQSLGNYVSGVENDVIINKLPDFSRFVLNESVKEQLEKGNLIKENLRIALNSKNKEEIEKAKQALIDYVIEIEFYYTKDKSNTGELPSQSVEEYLILAKNLGLEQALVRFLEDGVLIFDDKENNNSNQKLKIGSNSEEDQIISTFETAYLDENFVFEEKQTITTDENGNQSIITEKGITVVFFDGSKRFVSIREYESLKDKISIYKLTDKMLHIENDMSKTICPSIDEKNTEARNKEKIKFIATTVAFKATEKMDFNSQLKRIDMDNPKSLVLKI